MRIEIRSILMNSRAVLLKIYHSYQSPRDPVKTVSDSVGIGWGLRFCFSKKLSGDLETDGDPQVK